MPQYNRLDADHPGSEPIVRESDEAIARESAGLKGSKTLVRWRSLCLATSEPTESARAAARNR